MFLTNDMTFFTCMHSYGLFWFTPWGYTDELPSDYDEILKKINIGANAIKASFSELYFV